MFSGAITYINFIKPTNNKTMLESFTATPKGEGKSYNLNNQEDKFYYAIYTNVARHNVLIILNSIYQIVYDKPNVIDNEDNIAGHPLMTKLKEANDIRKVAYTQALLERWLPFAVAGIEDNYVSIAERLSNFLKNILEKGDLTHNFRRKSPS